MRCARGGGSGDFLREAICLALHKNRTNLAHPTSLMTRVDLVGTPLNHKSSEVNLFAAPVSLASSTVQSQPEPHRNLR